MDNWKYSRVWALPRQWRDVSMRLTCRTNTTAIERTTDQDRLTMKRKLDRSGSPVAISVLDAETNSQLLSVLSFKAVVATFLVGLTVLSGCGLPWKNESVVHQEADWQYYKNAATRVDYTDPYVAEPEEVLATVAPRTIDDDDPDFREITLQDAIQMALTNSTVLRDLGGLVLQSPNSTRSVFDPAIQELDPRFGVPAALSAFDAQFTGSATIQKNDRALNNQFFGGGTRILKQDVGIFQGEISKYSATGTEFALRNITDYDANNAPGNQFGSAWTVQYEAEVRQPLLQGAGIDFNRIAGPSDTPGVYNGVLIARVNTDISQAEFEQSVRALVNDVENVYLDLYYAYRELDARIAARDSALETWRAVHALYQAGRQGGEADKEAQAREQYFRFQEQVQNSLNGRLLQPTRGNNGSSGGTFRANGGVLVAERRLRYMIGMPITENELLRPADEPSLAPVAFDWNQALTEAVGRRVELRQQRWVIRSRELELKAARNFLLPQLDVVGLYRWRGFGRDLFEQHQDAASSVGSAGQARFDSSFRNRELNNAYDNLFNGDFQEYQYGLELNIPFGFRRAHSAVRNAELRLSRERAVLREQERLVALDLSNAISDAARAYAVVETNYNRRLAATQHLEAVEAAYEADAASLDVLLEAQRRLAEAETSYYQSVVEYSLAVKNVHFEKGSLLDYNAIYLEEGAWPEKAYRDSKERWELRTQPWRFNWFLQPGLVVSDGAAPQLVMPPPELENYDTSWDQSPADIIEAELPIAPQTPLPTETNVIDQPAAQPAVEVPETTSTDGFRAATGVTAAEFAEMADLEPTATNESSEFVDGENPFLLPAQGAEE